MIVPIANILNEEELVTIKNLIKDAEFEDGKKTAGWHAATIKNNEQICEGPNKEKISQVIQNALQRNEIFKIATLPHIVRPFLVSRSHNNGGYGTHVDNAIMAGQRASRTDISMTIFLSDPDSYEGGDLVIEETAGERHFRMPAGSAVAYPSTSLHRVDPVTEGDRLVACTWIQSRVRHAEQRQILFDLDTARRSIFQKDGKTHEFDLMSKTHANLIRMWAEL